MQACRHDNFTAKINTPCDLQVMKKAMKRINLNENRSSRVKTLINKRLIERSSTCRTFFEEKGRNRSTCP